MLAAHDVTFAFGRQAAPIIQNWSAEFPAGTMTALMGPSGRGKSTLLYILGLMLRPTGGEVRIDGAPVSRLCDAESAHLRAHRFGFVFQDAALDQTRTVVDNVTETALYRGQRRAATSRRALELLDRFGVDVPPNRKPGQVSGGQAQRIALCRALLSEPDIVLADEPTGNLDPSTTQVVVEALHEQASRGAVVIVVTHSPDVGDACDRRIKL
ncbi:MAG TPA: ABC transporter ATP-binding protein [Microbacterium sp.]|nr:ABC transporter ATP-binding protein [Microbacterium sp.]